MPRKGESNKAAIDSAIGGASGGQVTRGAGVGRPLASGKGAGAGEGGVGGASPIVIVGSGLGVGLNPGDPGAIVTVYTPTVNVVAGRITISQAKVAGRITISQAKSAILSKSKGKGGGVGLVSESYHK